MLFSIDEATMVVQGCRKQEKAIVIEQSLFAIIIVAQPCQQVVTVLMVEQCCNNIVVMAESLDAAQLATTRV